VSALMAVAVGQGVAAGGMEVLAGCVAANGYLGISRVVRVEKAGMIIRGLGLCIFAPLGGHIVDRGYNNWTVQVCWFLSPLSWSHRDASVVREDGCASSPLCFQDGNHWRSR
jgi:hypothetical protein